IGLGFALTGYACGQTCDDVPSPRAEPSVDAGPLPTLAMSAAELAPLCDGSTSLRLAMNLQPDGGLNLRSWYIDNPYGSFFVLDGPLHFYVQPGAALTGIREGTLSSDQARALSADLSVAQLSLLSSTRATCADGAVGLLTTQNASLACSCSDCGADSL